MPILYDLTSEPLAKTSIRNAGMLTTMRVSGGHRVRPRQHDGFCIFNGNGCRLLVPPQGALDALICRRGW